MTSHHYIETVLPKVVAAVQDQRPNVGTSRSMLLHDNAAPHKARATTQYLEAVQLHQLPHPAYSPDLAQCDFWLFPTLKAALVGKMFLRIKNLARTVNSQLHGIPYLEYRDAFQKWLRRLQHCVDSRGEYFETS